LQLKVPSMESSSAMQEQSPKQSQSQWWLDRSLVHTIMGPSPPSRLPEADVRLLNVVSTRELSELSGVSETDLSLLLEYGVLRALNGAGPAATFSVRSIPTLRRASRLKRDLMLEDEGFALAATLLFEIAKMEDELRSKRTARCAP
jgi:hypothetical protein